MKSKENRDCVSQETPTFRAGRVWHIYLQVGFIVILIVVTLWYALSTSTRITKLYAPQVSAAHHVKINAILAHLWFEEFISGDRSRDISIVWELIDQSEWYVSAMLEGGRNAGGEYIPLNDPILRQDLLNVLENIRALRNIAEERLADIDQSAIGSDIDQRFDEVFESFLNQTEIVETALKQIMTRDMQRFRSVQFALIMLCFVLTGIIAAILRRFEKTRSISMAMLNSVNQQLRAGEQQLRASEQQLKATNQQLTAHEQQLKAGNQQLRASEQQLKAANQQLKTSESLLLEAQQIAGLGFYALDMAAGTWTSSSILDKLFGIDKDFRRDVKGWLQIVHPDQRDEMSKYFVENILTQRELFNREYRVIRQDDQEARWVHGLGRLELDDNGEPIRMIGTIQDITERKLAEEKLQVSEEKFREIVVKSPIPMVIVDNNQDIELYNDKFIEVFGYTKEDITKADDWWNACYPHQEYRTKVRQGWEQAIKVAHDSDAEIAMQEWKLTCKDGSVRDVEFKLMPLGEISLIVLNDITETKRLQALQSRAERLETAGKIAGQVAHDFNNLLGPMIAYPDFIRSELSKDHSAIQMLNDIEKAATTMADINQQLLTLSRRGHFELETLNLNNVVKQSINQMDSQPDTLHIEIDLGKDLMNIKGGPAQLSRIISNLVNNALDAMRNVGHLFIKTENYYADDVSGRYGRIPKGEYVKLTITDTGHGINNEALPKIFDPFFTTKKTDKQRGSGLGLSVVHTVMEDHNGYIDLQSEFGQGTSFFLYFPITRDEIEALDSSEIVAAQKVFSL